MRSLLVALATAFTFALTAPAFAGDGTSTKAPRTPRVECKADKDCVTVPDGCCGCEAGGKQRAIPVRARKADEKDRAAKCKETMCAAVMSQDPSCTATAVCKEGTCALGQ